MIQSSSSNSQPAPANGSSSSQYSKEFVAKIKNIDLAEDDIVLSLDVNNLFTMTPTKETIDICMERFRNIDHPLLNCLPKLLDLYLNESYFEFNGRFYKQIDGSAMSQPISPKTLRRRR